MVTKSTFRKPNKPTCISGSKKGKKFVMETDGITVHKNIELAQTVVIIMRELRKIYVLTI